MKSVRTEGKVGRRREQPNLGSINAGKFLIESTVTTVSPVITFAALHVRTKVVSPTLSLAHEKMTQKVHQSLYLRPRCFELMSYKMNS